MENLVNVNHDKSLGIIEPRHISRKLPNTPSTNGINNSISTQPEQLPLEVQEQFLRRKRALHERSNSLTGIQVEDNVEPKSDDREAAKGESAYQLKVNQPPRQRTARSLPASPVTGRKGADDAFALSSAALSDDKRELMKELRWHYKQHVRESKRKKEKVTEPNAVNTSTSPIRTNRCDRCSKTVVVLERVAVENHVFHHSCFLCAICSTWLNHFNYCFIPDHDKFYCVQHYQDIESASCGMQENEIRHAMGIGPGVQQQFKFVPDNKVDSSAEKPHYSRKHFKATDIMKEKITLLNKRVKKLDKKEKKLADFLNKFKSKSDNEKRIVWLQWFDVIEERNSSFRRQEQLSFKLEELELSHKYSKLEKEIRLISEKEESCKTEEDRARENKLLQEMLGVVEKKEMLVLKTEAANHRHVQEDKDLKSKKDEIGIGQPNLVSKTTTTASSEDAKKVSQALKQAPMTAKQQSQLWCPSCILL